ncbi:MAG: glycosyltransferase family 4 protein [Blastocatellia bacterium]|nr:glycosyltransferase family 4 protein [Blastocatellia bacterium]
MKVLAIVPYHLDFCAGQRFRIELWAKELGKRGIEVEYLPFTNQDLTDVLYQQGKHFAKVALMLSAFIKQLTKTFQTKKPDLIFIYREAAIAGPAIIEKIVGRWNVPIVYDIDEPLFVPYKSPTNGYLNKLRFLSKIDKLFETSDCVFTVNRAIGDYAGKFNKNIEIVPMTVDINRYQPSEAKKINKKPIIAWVGTRTNQPMIELAISPMRQLATEKDFTFRIIADDEMKFEGLDVNFVPWAYDVEVPKLQEADIGIIPVKDSVWSPYKFFFKTVQFMSLGMPVVATATGSNLEIIQDGVNGFLAENEKDWYDKLKILLEDEGLRKEFGEKQGKRF